MKFTVNETLERLSAFGGELVEVIGLLAWRFENRSLESTAVAERGERGERSTLWLEVDDETPAMDEGMLIRWSGKRVVVSGILRAPDPKFGGCGHFSMWPAELLVRSIRRD
jgi:hypothetical protein